MTDIFDFQKVMNKFQNQLWINLSSLQINYQEGIIINKISLYNFKSRFFMINANQIRFRFQDQSGRQNPTESQNIDSLLMPMEVRLKSIGPDNYRLREVIRQENDQEGQTQIQIPSFHAAGNHNMNALSFYNRDGGDISTPKLAICICAYNQPRSMLEKSLLGVHRSLKGFRQKGGISSNQIVVIVIFDGIEKVQHQKDNQQESILSFFERIDVQNGLHRNRANEEMNSKRFEEKHRKYCQAKKLIEACKGKRVYDLDQVPKKVLEEYKLARSETLRRQYGGRFDTDPNFKKTEEQRFDNKVSRKKHTLELAYQKVKNNCEKMIRLRDDTSLVYPMRYRPEQRDPDEMIAEEAQLLNDEDQYLNVYIVIKHKNAKKLSSHALFFLGFCTMIKPDICMLLDVGLEPQGNSIYDMYKYMLKNDNTGGACGYMGLKVERAGDEFGKDSKLQKNIDMLSYFFHQYLFDIQKAQRFQYHMGHLIDKPFEAMFNFIHVLPGAFSCYRYECVRKGLTEYLAPALDPDLERTLEEENINLAEDRILSLGLKAAGYSFAYMPDVYAVVDPMSNLAGLIAQRRRWINGSWFAFHDVYSKRDQIKDCATQFQLGYYMFMHAMFYISIGIYFSTIYLTVQSLSRQFYPEEVVTPNGTVADNTSRIITSVVSFVYIVIVSSMIFLSLNEKSGDGRFQAFYYFVSTLLGIYGILILILMIYNLIEGLLHLDNPLFMGGYSGPKMDIKPIVPTWLIIAFMFGTVMMYGIQVVFAACFSKFCNYGCKIIVEVATSVHHFLFFAPTYLHNMMIYAFCKIDDFSWGTKGLDADDKSASYKTEKNKIQKYVHVFKFLLWNIIVAVVLCILIEYDQSKQIVIAALGAFFFINTFFKFIVSFLYLFCYACKNKQIDEGSQIKNQRQSNNIKNALRERRKKIDDLIQKNEMEYENELNQRPLIDLGRSEFIYN